MQKEMRLKMHNTPFHPPSPHANLSSIIQHKRDNRQTARGHLQRAGCQGRPVERAKACPHQSPAAVGEPQRCSFPWGCSEIQRWRIKLELAISSGQLCTLLQGRHKREGLGYFNPSLHPIFALEILELLFRLTKIRRVKYAAAGRRQQQGSTFCSVQN